MGTGRDAIQNSPGCGDIILPHVCVPPCYWGIPQQGTHWQNSHRSLLDNYHQIDAVIGDIVFYGFADHVLHPVRDKTPFWSHCCSKTRELGGPRFINKACILYKRLLGTCGVMQVQSKLRRSKFSQMNEQYALHMYKSTWFSCLGAGHSP